ncbi:MAG TPA: FxLYD domain-containing protein [Nitrososphaeraceae archaeon]
MNPVGIIFLILLMPFNMGPTCWAATADFQTKRTNLFIDNNGYLHLLGELVNTSDMPKKNIIIYATFFDSKGNMVGNTSASTAVRSMNRNYISPFELLLSDKEIAKKATNFSLEFKSENSVEKNYSLQEISIPRSDIFGFYYVNGRVINEGDMPAANTLVIATFYDKYGKVLDISKAMTEPVNITSNQASFSVVMDERERSANIKNYSLIVDSDQYLSPQ